MGWENIAVAGIGAAGSLIGGVGKGRKARHEQWITNERNIAFQQQVNQQNMDWNREMWDKTNEYNSPAMQMARFKAAGLNPHLIYGQGTIAQQPHEPNLTAPSADPLPIDTSVNEIGQGFMAAAQNYVANRKQQTEVDNLKKTQDVMDAQITNTNAQTANTLATTARTTQQTQQAADLWTNTVATAEANLRNTGLQGDSIEQQIRASKTGQRLSEAQIQSAAQSIQESTARIDLLRQQGETNRLDQEVKKLDIKLKELGLQPSDSPLLRIPVQLYHKMKGAKMPWDDAPQKKQQYFKKSQR